MAPRRKILPPRPPLGVDTSTHHDGTYWRCHRCARWGREGWTHICDAGATVATGNNWFVTVQALRDAEYAYKPRAMRRPFLSSVRA